MSSGDDAIAVILLAAGGSSRMGRPKQLLQYRGQSLLRHAAVSALVCGCGPVVVVIGYDAALMRRELMDLEVVTADNPDWQRGMGTSIRVGVTTVQSISPASAAVMIALCDQPLVDAGAMRRLIAEYRTSGFPIAAAVYSGSVGVPAIFNRNYFEALRTLPPHAGAKKVLSDQATQVAKVELEEAKRDVDTEEDYRELSGDR